jgi:hypothetical protein
MKIYRYNLNKWCHNDLDCEEFDVDFIANFYQIMIKLHVYNKHKSYYVNLYDFNRNNLYYFNDINFHCYCLRKLSEIEMEKLKNGLLK